MRPTLPRLAIASLALLAGAQAAAAQQPRAPGSVLILQVRDEQGHAISDAQVTVGGLRRSGRSDAAGEAFITQVPAGNRLIELRRQGFGMMRIAADFSGADTVRREVRMTPQPIELEGVVATSWGRSMRLRSMGFYDRQRRGLGAFLTRQRLDEINATHTRDIFRQVRGFLVRPVGPYDVVEGARGFGIAGCLPAIYIDGMRMIVRDVRDQSDALGMVGPEDIEAIEAYQGPASIPAEYNPLGNACGVILIWTRNAGSSS
ncbi:MAG TPA: TonB-dependent receptor [Longimicrobiaceae bacterium]|nr:TonB-dependent receptor [Longimicrobiaceae bacterium]